MGELTTITDVETEYDLVNTLLISSVAIIVLSLIIFGGNFPEKGGFDLIVVGAAMGVGMLLGYLFIGKSMFESPATASQGAFSIFIGYVIGSLAGIGGAFTVYNPEDAIYSSFLTNAPEVVQLVLHLHLAPFVENIFIIGLVLVLYKSLKNTVFLTGMNNVFRNFLFLLIALFAGSIVFSAIHWGNSLEFLVRAFIFISVLVGVLIAADEDILSSSFFPATIGGIYAVHRQVNTDEFGGWLEFYNVVLSAGMPELIIGLIVIILDFAILALIVLPLIFGSRGFVREVLDI